MPGRSSARGEPLGFWRMFRPVHAASTKTPSARDVQSFCPGDAPAVAVGTARVRSDAIGSGLRFGESLTPDHLAGGDGGQVLGFLLVGSVSHQRRSDPVDTHVLGTAGSWWAHISSRNTVCSCPGAATTAVFLRPGQGQQSVGCEHFAERLGGRHFVQAPRKPSGICVEIKSRRRFRVRQHRRGRCIPSAVRQSLGDDVALDLRCPAIDGRRKRVLTFEEQIGVVDRTGPAAQRKAPKPAAVSVNRGV